MLNPLSTVNNIYYNQYKRSDLKPNQHNYVGLASNPILSDTFTFCGKVSNSDVLSEKLLEKIMTGLKDYFFNVNKLKTDEFYRILHSHNKIDEALWKNIEKFFTKNPDVKLKVQENAIEVENDRSRWLSTTLAFLNSDRSSLRNSSHSGFYGSIDVTNGYEKSPIDVYNDAKTLIDIGCGDGRITEMTAGDLGFRLENIQGVDVCEPPSHELPFPFLLYKPESEFVPLLNGRQFDVGSLISVLHHSKDSKALIKQAAEVIKDGGHLIVVEHPYNNKNTALFHTFMDRFEYVLINGIDDFPITNNFYTQDELLEMMQEYGFKLIRKNEAKESLKIGNQEFAFNLFGRTGYLFEKVPNNLSLDTKISA